MIYSLAHESQWLRDALEQKNRTKKWFKIVLVMQNAAQHKVSSFLQMSQDNSMHLKVEEKNKQTKYYPSTSELVVFVVNLSQSMEYNQKSRRTVHCGGWSKGWKKENRKSRKIPQCAARPITLMNCTRKVINSTRLQHCVHAPPRPCIDLPHFSGIR